MRTTGATGVAGGGVGCRAVVFVGALFSGLEEGEEELVFSCLEREKEQDTLFLEGCKRSVLALPEA